MDDLVEWFAEANGFSQGRAAPHKWVLQAEQELRIQAATIARQQVVLDRALEASFNDKARADRLDAALREIVARWDTPAWKDVEPTAAVINRARAALAPPKTPPTPSP